MSRFTVSAIGDCISAPVFLLGRNRQVMYANPAANRILDGRLCLKLESGRLLVTDRGVLNLLQLALDQVVISGRIHNAAIPLPAIQCGVRAVLHLASTTANDADAESQPALIAMINCARELEPEELARIRETLGLSGVEAEIAALLLAGHAPREIAKRRDSSEQTVRWHLKNMHSKTQTRRLTELVLQLQTARSPF